jgi:hypothetical protein
MTTLTIPNEAPEAVAPPTLHAHHDADAVARRAADVVASTVAPRTAAAGRGYAAAIPATVGDLEAATQHLAAAVDELRVETLWDLRDREPDVVGDDDVDAYARDFSTLAGVSTPRGRRPWHCANGSRERRGGLTARASSLDARPRPGREAHGEPRRCPATRPMRRMCTSVPMSDSSPRRHDGHANQNEGGNVAASRTTHDFQVPLDSDDRAVAVGAAPDGRAETVAGSSEMDPLPAGALSDVAVIDAIAGRLAGVVSRTRERIARTSESDPVSEDLLITVAGTLEKQLWMVRTQRARA